MSKLYISMYHYVRDLINGPYPNIKGMDITLFRHQIEYMKNHFNIVEMEQVIEAVNGKTTLPDNAMLLTFDDGYIDNYTYVFPILDEYGLQGSFFIPGKTFTTHQLLDVNKIHYVLASASINDLMTDLIHQIDFYRGNEYEIPPTNDLINEYAIANRFDSGEIIFVKRMLQTVLPEKLRGIISSNLFSRYLGITEKQLACELYMSEDHIRTIKRHGMYIGIHGYDHYWLGNLSKEQMQKDILTALSVMDEFIDQKKWVMNYPYGDYNDEVIDFISEKGATLGLTTDVKVCDIQTDNRYKFPRLDCNDFPPKSENFKLADSNFLGD